MEKENCPISTNFDKCRQWSCEWYDKKVEQCVIYSILDELRRLNKWNKELE